MQQARIVHSVLYHRYVAYMEGTIISKHFWRPLPSTMKTRDPRTCATLHARKQHKIFFAVVLFLLSTVLLCDVRPRTLTICDNHREARYNAHQEVNFWVDNYLSWHKANRHNASRVLVFYPQHNVGIGDNLRGMLRTYGFAVLTGRLFLVNWTFPHPLSDVVSTRVQESFLYNQRTDAPQAQREEDMFTFQIVSTKSQRLEKLLHKKLKTSTHTVSVSSGQSATNLNLVVSKLRINQWKGMRIPSFSERVRRKVAHVLLEPSVELAEAQKIAEKKFGFCVPRHWLLPKCASNTKRYISVHARLGIGFGEDKNISGSRKRFEKFTGNEGLIAACFANHVKSIAAKTKDASPKIFVATDTPDFKRIFRREMQRILPQCQVYYSGNLPVHFSKIPRDSEEGRNAHMALHAEMRMVGDAEHIVSFKSGFSKAAYWMGEAISYTVIPADSCTSARKT